MHKVLEITNKYISIATPLILYSLLSSVYLAISANGGKLIHLIFAIILLSLLISIFPIKSAANVCCLSSTNSFS